jgi:uncharacterized membrane protein YfcA
MLSLAALRDSIDPQSIGLRLLLATFAAVTLWYIRRWWVLEHGRGALSHLRGTDVLVGFGSNFFDVLGVGCFAPTAAIFKLQQRMPDDELPGTLNAGNALPSLTEALLFVSIVTLDITTLVVMIGAAVLGAWFGAGLVARAPRRAIQLGMGVALLISAGLLLANNLHWMPSGSGDALALHDGTLWVAVAINGLLGALMMVGVGLYAPCLILVTLLGMNPLAALPIIMGSSALPMAVGGARFVRARRYSPGAALGLTIGGIPGVLCAAFIVRSLPVGWLRWLVAVVAVYAAVLMLLSARREARPV